MTQSTVAPVDRIATAGVDTRSDIHVAVAVDQLGRPHSGTTTIPTTPQAHQRLEAWAQELGPLEALGIATRPPPRGVVDGASSGGDLADEWPLWDAVRVPERLAAASTALHPVSQRLLEVPKIHVGALTHPP